MPLHNEIVFDEPYMTIPEAILVDGLLQSFLLGYVLGQAAKYWSDYSDDSIRKRIYVAVVVMLSIVQTILEEYKLWTVSIGQRTWATSSLIWSNLFITACISLLCECYFIRRCWKMTGGSKWILYPMSFLVITILLVNIYLVTSVTISLEASNHGTPMENPRLILATLICFTYWVFGSLALDVSVASILTIYLWRSKIGVRGADKVLLRVIAMTCECAILPSITMLIAVGLFHANPQGQDNLVLLFVLLTGKLYAYCLLRTLNSRTRLRERMKSHDLGRTSLGDWQWNQGETAVAELPRAFDNMATYRSIPERSSLSESIAPDEGIPAVVSGRSISDLQHATPSMDARERGVAKCSKTSINTY